MVHGVRGCQNHAASRRKSQSNESMSGYFQAGATVGCDLHNAALAGERRRYIQVAGRVKSQPLRASQAAVKRVHSPLRIDSMYTVKTRCGRPGHKQVALRTESQVVCRDARLQSGKHEDLLVASNLKDGTAAVAYIEILVAIKSNSRGDSHPFGIRGHASVRSHAINCAVMPRRNIHLSLAIEGDRSRVHHLRDERFHRVVGINLENRDWNLLSA